MVLDKLTAILKKLKIYFSQFLLIYIFKDNTQKKTRVKTGVLNFCLERVGLHAHPQVD